MAHNKFNDTEYEPKQGSEFIAERTENKTQKKIGENTLDPGCGVMCVRACVRAHSCIIAASM